MQFQLNHSEFKKNQVQNKNNIIFVLENLEHMENIGSAFRLADAFNIEKIIIITKTELNMQKIKKTARNCETTIPYSIHNNVDNALKEVKQYNYTPLNIEITSTSKPLRECNIGNKFGVALIVGNESHGVSEEMLAKVPQSAHIEMYGNNSSMNVTTALAISTYKISEDFIIKKNNEQILGG